MELKQNKIYKYKHITETGIEVQRMFQVLEAQEQSYIIDCGNGTGRIELTKENETKQTIEELIETIEREGMVLKVTNQ